MELNRKVLCTGLGFVESPRWHDDRLWVSDMATHEVLAIDADGTTDVICEMAGSPSGLGWLADGTLLVVSMHDRVVLGLYGTELRVHADLGPFVAADLNDMVVDGTGRAYVTNFGYAAAADVSPVATGLILVHPNGRIEPPTGELFRPNGCAITADGKTLVVAETRLHRLSTFAIDERGGLSNQGTMGSLPSGTWADGICLDIEGGAWIADPKGRQCVRMGADGTITHTIDTRPLQAIACALGGQDRTTLFITLAIIRSFDEMASDRRAQIDMIIVDVPGAGFP